MATTDEFLRDYGVDNYCVPRLEPSAEVGRSAMRLENGDSSKSGRVTYGNKKIADLRAEAAYNLKAAGSRAPNVRHKSNPVPATKYSRYINKLEPERFTRVNTRAKRLNANSTFQEAP